GYTATKPADPSSETLPAPFSFWATSATATTAFSFATPITSDITLYAVCYTATDATSFSGTVEQFLATEFANTSSATSPYPITITGVTNANLESIVNHLSEFSVLGDDGYYSKELYSNLTLSGDGLTEIPASMFSTSTGKYSNGKIMAINLPDSVTKIGNSAFYGMTKLASITLPSNLEEIGQSAFAYMGSSSGVGVAITLPASVKKIYVNAFSSSNLTSLTVEGTNEEWVRRDSNGDALSFSLSLDVTSFSSDAGEYYDRY
ncbi:MAG: leucine-rich repeat domain-containing protein, partial [Treponema sp.]|nr:leucine-rich repeat domain-containing protein [Treponema sp.]